MRQRAIKVWVKGAPQQGNSKFKGCESESEKTCCLQGKPINLVLLKSNE